jgi:hypothetical protein
MNRMQWIAPCVLSIAALAGAACGPDERGFKDPSVSIEAPAKREARVALTPALDVTALYDPAIADRVVVERIRVNVADVRLLGADPRIPAGGLEILGSSRVVTADASSSGTVLPFPDYLLAQDDLSIYIRLDESDSLAGSSVVVSARVYSRPVGDVEALTQAPDPDGDPADKGGTKKSQVLERVANSSSPDPDGDPAHCAPDPDGDPASPKRCIRAHHYGLSSFVNNPSVSVELRGADVADLVTALNRASALDVVVGVPASRWFTPDSMQRIDALLAQQSAPTPSTNDAPQSSDLILERVATSMGSTLDNSGQLSDPASQYVLMSGESGLLKIQR